MSKSKPRDFCWLLKMLWEENRQGEEYHIMPRDMKAAKEYLEVNGDVPAEETCRGVMKRFCESDFEGWKEQGYPIHAVINNWMRYMPRKEVTKKRTTYNCPKCGTVHGVQEECPPQRSTGPIITELGKHMRMK